MNDDHLDNLIKSKVRELDNSYPDDLASEDNLWRQILLRKQKQTRLIRIQWSIAATLLLLIIAGAFWRVSVTRDDHYHSLPVADVVSAQEYEALEYIKKRCNGNNISCNSPAFKELQDELKESSLSLIEIDKQIQVFGTDANLARAKTRIENHQANIIRAMVQTL